MSSNLFVGNLSYRTSDDGLRAHFETVGTVVSAKVILDRDTKRSRGFGFVEMSTEDEAKKAVEQLDGKNLDGRALRINSADERPARREGGGGFGGDRRGGGGGGGYGGDRRGGGGGYRDR
jgi:RNA recognition motif-containing protein